MKVITLKEREMKLGEKIKKLRNDAELTQPELADKAQIEQSYLSKLENEKGTPSFDVIEKIAQAFEMNAMDLIESLDLDYIQKQLGHIPEIAVKTAEKHREKQVKIKRLYILSVVMVVLGVALFYAGHRGLFVANSSYEYYSAGFINEGEPLKRFSIHRIQIINENNEEFNQRIKENRSRLDELYLFKHDYRGEKFVEHYGKQRRYFDLVKSDYNLQQVNKAHELLGILFFICGWFGMFYIYRFKRL